MSPGSSGGGWFAYFDRNVGAGYLIAVNSTGNAMLSEGSILGRQAFELYQQAGGYGQQDGPTPTAPPTA